MKQDKVIKMLYHNDPSEQPAIFQISIDAQQAEQPANITLKINN